MTRRKQKLLKRYLDEMLMRLEKYVTDAEVKNFLMFDLERLEEMEFAKNYIKQTSGALDFYLRDDV